MYNFKLTVYRHSIYIYYIHSNLKYSYTIFIRFFWSYGILLGTRRTPRTLIIFSNFKILLLVLLMMPLNIWRTKLHTKVWKSILLLNLLNLFLNDFSRNLPQMSTRLFKTCLSIIYPMNFIECKKEIEIDNYNLIK